MDGVPRFAPGHSFCELVLGYELCAGRAAHEEVFLGVGADEEDLFTDDFKAPLFVEGDGAGVSGEDAEPEGAGDFGVEGGEGAVEEGIGESGAVVGGVEIELAEFAGGGGDRGVRAAAGGDGVSDDALRGFGEEDEQIGVLDEGTEALGRELGGDVGFEVRRVGNRAAEGEDTGGKGCQGRGVFSSGAADGGRGHNQLS